MNRAEMLSRVRARREPWDMLIIGGGATGVGMAVDAASRGYDVLLVEQSDFGKGTSSRSTKLVHGGVRYLEQGNISLVMEALRERGILRRNAPHLVRDLAFIVPNYDWWEAPFYGLGLKIYNVLAGRYNFGPSRMLTREETLALLPNIRTDRLRGGVIYYDGQFDDARLLINLAETASEQGAALVNYVQVTGLTRDDEGFVGGAIARDIESGDDLHIGAKVVINACGPFCDAVRRLAEPDSAPLITPSQGIHLVFHRSFLPGDSAIMVPHTSDGRVMFAIPWHGHTLVGTTDTPVSEAALEPRALNDEIDFILTTAGEYLHKPPSRADILSVFAGIRPLVRSADVKSTATLSRDHTIHIDRSGLLTITGGKWTTYRNMAEDGVNQAATLARLPEKPCITTRLPIHRTDAAAIAALGLNEQLHPALPYRAAEVVWAVRMEMARTVEDVLARRTRALFLNARAASAMAPAVARLMARELERDETWQHEQLEQFTVLAQNYLVLTTDVTTR